MTRCFTAADLEKLMEGTPPGPWHHIGHGYLETSSGEPLNGKIDWDGAIHPDCGDLAAAAPELAAEHHRIITAIEDRIRALRAPLCSRMPEGDEMDEYVEQWERQQYEISALTRILEGESNE